MYKGFVLSESLKNPVILNDFERIRMTKKLKTKKRRGRGINQVWSSAMYLEAIEEIAPKE